MTHQPSIGIDYGTSKSVITWIKPGQEEAQVIRNFEGDESTPSAVYFGDSETLVGNMALNMMEEDDGDGVVASAKRSLGLEVVYRAPGSPTPVDAAAAIMRYLLDTAHKDAEVQSSLDGPIEAATITCPATFTSFERERLVEAGKLAGLKRVMLRDEPVSAAIACTKALPGAVGQTVLVYDLGAGTFDVAVLTQDGGGRWRQAASASGARFGGDDFDLALFRFLNAKAMETSGCELGDSTSVLLRKCRHAKESLVNFGRTNFSHPLPNSQVFRHVVTRDDFYGLIHPMVTKTIECVDMAMRQAEQNGHPVESLVLIGGSSRIPLVRELVSSRVNRAPLEWNRREYAVALGAHGIEGMAEAAPEAVNKPTEEYRLGEQIGTPWTGHQKRAALSNGIRTLAFSRDGKLLVSGGFDETIRLWDVESGRQLGEPWRGHQGEITSLCFSAEGGCVASGGADGTIRIWDIETGAEICEPVRVHGAAVLGISCRLDGSLFVSGSADRNLVAWEPEGDRLSESRGLAGDLVLRALAFSPDLNMVAYGGENQAVNLLNRRTGQEAVIQQTAGAIRSVHFDPTMQRFASGGNDGGLRLYSLPDASREKWVMNSPNNGISSLSLTSSFSVAGISAEPRCVRVMTHPEPVLDVCFSPDGVRIVTACSDGKLRLWDVESGNLVGDPWSGHSRMVWSVAFSPDGKVVASGGNDCTIRLWKAAEESEHV